MNARRGSARLFAVAVALTVLTGCSAQAPPAAEVPSVSPAPSEAAPTAQFPAAPAPSEPPTTPAPAVPGANQPGANQPVPKVGLPSGVPEQPAGTGQLVTVVASSASATSATLRTWERQPGGGWRATTGPLRVRVGTDGVGRASESTRRTPAGSYTLDQAFGRAPDPGTKLPYRHVGNDDWWVSDAHSAAYNTYRHCRPGTCGFDESAGENLGQAGASYDYALVIGYNTAKPVAGAGSAFFLHVDAGVASAGCVEVPRASVVSLLRWLDPARHPRIAIAIG